jgi:hypothetical protein
MTHSAKSYGIDSLGDHDETTHPFTRQKPQKFSTHKLVFQKAT